MVISVVNGLGIHQASEPGESTDHVDGDPVRLDPDETQRSARIDNQSVAMLRRASRWTRLLGVCF